MDVDLKCEAFLGDDLKRSKVKFLYETSRAFYDSPARSIMLNQEEQGKAETDHLIHDLIPKLTAFRTLIHMHEIDKAKKKDKQEEEMRLKMNPQPKIEEQENINENQEENQEDEKEEKEQEEEEEEEDKELKEQRLKEEKKQKQEEEDKKYGRYMIWEGILPENCYDNWAIEAKQIDGLNMHIVEDIQDFIVKESFKPDTEEGKKLVLEIKKKIEKKRNEILNSDMEDQKNELKIAIKLEQFRPDKRVWNFFLEKNSPYYREHKFRIDANPFGIYTDGRVEKLWEVLKKLELEIKTYEQEQWNVILKLILEILANDMYKEQQAQYEQ